MDPTTEPLADDSSGELIDAFQNCGWQAVLNNVDRFGYTPASQALFKAANEAYNNGNELHGKVLRLLANVCSMMLLPNTTTDPFGPMLLLPGRRSAIAEDFTAADIAFFVQILGCIDNPLLKARLADLVWSIDKTLGVEFAHMAIDSYMEFPLTTDEWFIDGQRGWERAIGLSRLIRTAAGDRLEQIQVAILSALEQASAKDMAFGLTLAETLYSGGLVEGHSSRVAEQLEVLAREFEADGSHYLSGRCFHNSAKWYALSKDDEKSYDMTAEEAGSYVREGEARLASEEKSHGVAASFFENAVQVYRSIPRAHRGRLGVDERIQDLRARITEHGQLAVEQFSTISTDPVDIGELVDQTRTFVSGHPMGEALKRFSNLLHTDFNGLREQAITSLSDSTLRAIIPKYMTSNDGRIVARTPGLSGDSPSLWDETEVRAEMMQFHYSPLIALTVHGKILPARDVLASEHRIREADFIELARRSPIVPRGREILFGKALAHGFNLDFPSALHLLAPQIEHMVRFHLKAAGVTTSHLDVHGIETENGLSTLIELPMTKTIFGENLTGELRALFCDQIGPNFRNNTAHGLVDDSSSYSPEAIYAWWLGVKLVFRTFWNSQKHQQAKSNSDAEEEQADKEMTLGENEPEQE